MFRQITTGLALTALIACGKSDAQQAAADSLARDLELAPAESTTVLNDQPTGGQPAPTPSPAAPKPRPSTPAPAPTPSAPATHTMTLASGTTINGTANDSLHSRHDNAGKTFRVTVSQDMKDANGRVAIPAGSVVTFKVTLLEPAKGKNDADGRVRIAAQEVAIGGASYPISGEAGTQFIEHDLKGQGVTAGGAVRVGAGAAGGAVAGKVVGGKTGAVVGGIAGAVGGAILANQTADRDVIVAPGFQVIFTLTSAFTVTR